MNLAFVYAQTRGNTFIQISTHVSLTMTRKTSEISAVCNKNKVSVRMLEKREGRDAPFTSARISRQQGVHVFSIDTASIQHSGLVFPPSHEHIHTTEEVKITVVAKKMLKNPPRWSRININVHTSRSRGCKNNPTTFPRISGQPTSCFRLAYFLCDHGAYC